jgi:putative SbcD/Mre11-related phosphoesterase
MNDSTTTRAEVAPGVFLDAGPAVFIAPIRTLVVADVHWGYAQAQRDAGRLVPLWGDDDIDARLDRLVAETRAARLVIVGDIVHRAGSEDRAARTLERLAGALEVRLVAGNHDRRARLEMADTLELDGWFFHHGDRTRVVPGGCVEVVGHHHPAAFWSDGAGTRIKMPACVVGPRRIVLPAFSPWAGGVPWNDRLATDERLWVVSRRRVFPLATRSIPTSVTGRRRNKPGPDAF